MVCKKKPKKRTTSKKKKKYVKKERRVKSIWSTLNRGDDDVFRTEEPS